MRGFLRGVFATKDLISNQADILVISEMDALAEAADAISHKTKQMSCHGIFIDSERPPEEEFVTFLLQSRFTVFMPFSKVFFGGVIPVIEAEVSGGSLSEYLESARSAFPHFSVSIRRSAYEIALPADEKPPRELSQKELRFLISSYEPDIFFSPQLMCKYFLINTEGDFVRLILFDDSETISGKLRLAKKHGVSHAFLVYREIADIFDNISF